MLVDLLEQVVVMSFQPGADVFPRFIQTAGSMTGTNALTLCQPPFLQALRYPSQTDHSAGAVLSSSTFSCKVECVLKWFR